MTATVTPLFTEPWEERVRRLALRIKELQANPKPPSDWSKKEREAWKTVNYQLAVALQEVPA